jgi:thiol-disulfide isomerase/thioredoxin
MENAMNRRWIGAAGLALALLGCSEDPTRLPVVDESAPPPPSLPHSARATELAKSPLLASNEAPAPRDDKPPTTAEEALKRGIEAAQKNDLNGAITAFEQGVKLEPKNRQLLFFLTLARQLRAGQIQGDDKAQMAMFLSSAETARTLRSLAEKDVQPQEKGIIAQALYNEACCYAKDKQPDKALLSVTEAVDAGFSDDKTMASDDDLKSIKDRPEFAKLIARVQETARKEAKARDEMMTRQVLPEVKDEMPKFKSFPFAFELPGLDGKPVKLDDFKGKVTIVDVWGTWCPPCKMEIPHFVALRNAYKDKGLEIVGINKERVAKGKEEVIEPFAKENGINYPLVIGDDKVEEQIPEFSGYPTTLFLDREGKVRYKHTGYATYEVLEYIVKTLLDEKPKNP